jgi:hypothetical protein
MIDDKARPPILISEVDRAQLSKLARSDVHLTAKAGKEKGPSTDTGSL